MSVIFTATYRCRGCGELIETGTHTRNEQLVEAVMLQHTVEGMPPPPNSGILVGALDVHRCCPALGGAAAVADFVGFTRGET